MYIILQVIRKSRKNKNMSPRQQIYFLEKKRVKLVWKLLDSIPVEMIAASLMHIYKTCSTPNCKCKKGEKHGPYPAIQYKSKDKYKIKLLQRNKLDEIEKKVFAYREYQDGLAELNKLNIKINKLLQELRDKNIEEYR